MAKLTKKEQRQIAHMNCREFLRNVRADLPVLMRHCAYRQDNQKIIDALKDIWKMACVHWVNLIKSYWPF
jgi:precorrin-3B methylase